MYLIWMRFNATTFIPSALLAKNQDCGPLWKYLTNSNGMAISRGQRPFETAPLLSKGISPV